MTRKPKPLPIARVIARPKVFVARLVLGDLIARRREGPLRRKVLVYTGRKR